MPAPPTLAHLRQVSVYVASAADDVLESFDGLGEWVDGLRRRHGILARPASLRNVWRLVPSGALDHLGNERAAIADLALAARALSSQATPGSTFSLLISWLHARACDSGAGA